MNKSYSPIALFTYLRLKKLKKLINELKKNQESKNSVLYIFSDGAKNKKDHKKVEKVRAFIKKIKGFKKKIIILRKNNWGNGKNIIDGTTYVLNKNKTVIVLEDDLRIGDNFLLFMNTCLQKYKHYKRVWHIGGWSFPLNRESKFDVFFSKNPQPWGWATWHDKWKHFEKNPKRLIHYFNRKKERIYRFNQKGIINNYKQIEDNYYKKKDSWAIFWSAQIFKNNALCISPHKSFVKSDGFDNYSTHVHSSHFLNVLYKTDINKKKKFNLPDKIEEDLNFNDDFKKFYYRRLGIKFLIKNYLVKVTGYSLLIIMNFFKKIYKYN